MLANEAEIAAARGAAPRSSRARRPMRRYELSDSIGRSPRARSLLIGSGARHPHARGAATWRASTGAVRCALRRAPCSRPAPGGRPGAQHSIRRTVFGLRVECASAPWRRPGVLRLSTRGPAGHRRGGASLRGRGPCCGNDIRRRRGSRCDRRPRESDPGRRAAPPDPDRPRPGGCPRFRMYGTTRRVAQALDHHDRPAVSSPGTGRRRPAGAGRPTEPRRSSAGCRRHRTRSRRGLAPAMPLEERENGGPPACARGAAGQGCTLTPTTSRRDPAPLATRPRLGEAWLMKR